MRNQELIELVDDLLKEGKELSWLEFKEGNATRKEIDTLLLNKLPNYLSVQQKKRRLSNMIQDLKERKLIENVGTRSLPKWIKVVKG